MYFFPYDTMNPDIVKRKNAVIANRRKVGSQSPFYGGDSCTGGTPARNDSVLSLLTEGLAVSTLIHGGVGLMGTYQNPLQGAEVCILAVMGTLLDSTLNALVCMTIHNMILLFS